MLLGSQVTSLVQLSKILGFLKACVVKDVQYESPLVNHVCCLLERVATGSILYSHQFPLKVPLLSHTVAFLNGHPHTEVRSVFPLNQDLSALCLFTKTTTNK